MRRKAQVSKNLIPKKPMKYKFHIPSKKLPGSLAQKICSPLWKSIIDSIEAGNVEPVQALVKSIDKHQEAICLPHPFLENLDTFVTKNMRQGMCNFIFFSDSSNQNQWILCQCTSFVDAIFTESYAGKHKSSVNDDAILNAIRKLFNGKNKISSRRYGTKKATFSGYLLDQKRPYHHFYDQLKWLVWLETDKPIRSNNSFFIPSHYKKLSVAQKNKPTFSLFPLVIGSNQLGMKLDQYSEKMEKVVYLDSTQGWRNNVIRSRWNQVFNQIKKVFNKSNTLTLWFGISGQKRIWIEQEDFLPAFVQQLTPWFDSFVFMIDGFTEYENSNHARLNGSKATPVNQDLEVVASIRKKLLPFSNVSVVSLVGQTYREKIQHCQAVDFFIANAGAGQLVPHRFCKKPGILHSNEKHCVFPTGINNTTVKIVDKSLVKDVGNLFAKGTPNKNLGAGLISYSINSKIVINMTKQMLNLDDEAMSSVNK